MKLLTMRLTLMTSFAVMASGTLHAATYGVSRSAAAVRGPNGNVAVAGRRTVVAGGGGVVVKKTTVVAGGGGNGVVVKTPTVVVRPLPSGYVRVVPTGYTTVVYGGYNCFFVGGIYYRAVFYEGETVYVTVH